jgi:hypothetical protein
MAELIRRPIGGHLPYFAKSPVARRMLSAWLGGSTDRCGPVTHGRALGQPLTTGQNRLPLWAVKNLVLRTFGNYAEFVPSMAGVDRIAFIPIGMTASSRWLSVSDTAGNRFSTPRGVVADGLNGFHRAATPAGVERIAEKSFRWCRRYRDSTTGYLLRSLRDPNAPHGTNTGSKNAPKNVRNTRFLTAYSRPLWPKTE